MKANEEIKTNSNLTIELMNLITESGADLIAGFLVLYTYLTSDSVIRGEAKNNKDNKSNSNDPLKKINKCSLILIVSMIEFIYKSTSLFSFFYNKEYILMIFLSILSRTSFSRYFLRNKLYKHHFVSLTLFLVEYFFMCILTFCAGDLKFEN